jgi:hypothetical protein
VTYTFATQGVGGSTQLDLVRRDAGLMVEEVGERDPGHLGVVSDLHGVAG